MKKPIKHICPVCEHIERGSWAGYIGKLLWAALAAVGTFSILIIMLMGPQYFGTVIGEMPVNFFAKQHQDEMRITALNFTTYDGDDAFSFAEDLMAHMPRIRYVLPSYFQIIYHPKEVLASGGDCKNSAILFTSMMLSVGHQAVVDCNQEQHHCVTRIESLHPDDPFISDAYMIVDLTNDEVAYYHHDVDHWETPKKFIKAYQII